MLWMVIMVPLTLIGLAVATVPVVYGLVREERIRREERLVAARVIDLATRRPEEEEADAVA